MHARVLLFDLPARVIIFILLHGVIYVISADWFGSFVTRDEGEEPIEAPEPSRLVAAA